MKHLIDSSDWETLPHSGYKKAPRRSRCHHRPKHKNKGCSELPERLSAGLLWVSNLTVITNQEAELEQIACNLYNIELMRKINQNFYDYRNHNCESFQQVFQKPYFASKEKNKYLCFVGNGIKYSMSSKMGVCSIKSSPTSFLLHF